MHVVGLDHVQLVAPPGCEEDARQFFGAVLGLDEIDKPEALRPQGGVWFVLGEQQLHIGVDPEFAPARKAHPALVVARGRLEEVAERLLSAGVEVIWDDAIPDVARFFCKDPWGNRIELLEARR